MSPFKMLSRTAGLRTFYHLKTEYSEANRKNLRKQRCIWPTDDEKELRYRLNEADKKGSITLEAALTLPLFLAVMTGLLSFFIFMTLEMKMQSAMEIVGQRIAAYMYVSDCFKEAETGETEKMSILKEIGIEGADLVVTEMTAKGLVINEMDGYFADERIVEGGTRGVSFAGSYYDRVSKDLILHASYDLKIPFVAFAGLTLPISQQSFHHVWAGKELEKRSDEELVYFTEHGEVYHTHLDCSYLKLSIREVPAKQIGSKRNQDGGTYQKCEVCGDVGGDTVFITDYGDCYHFDRNCSGLKRGIKSAPISSVGKRNECSRCRKRDQK